MELRFNHVKYVRLNFLALLCLSLAPAAFAANLPPSYHLITFPAHHLQCVLAFKAEAPNLDASEWLVIAPLPQNSAGQSVEEAKLSVDNLSTFTQTVLDSEEQRPVQELSVFAAQAPLVHSLSLRETYDVTLNARWLEPGPPSSTPVPLSDVERLADTEATGTTDYRSPSLQSWVERYGLSKAADEDDLTFGRRVFDQIRALYTYSFNSAQDRRASAICAASAADCGGLSNLFVAVMRLSSVPARIDAGRWVNFDGTDDGAKDVHVKSEFYADGIGWVPVEMSGAVSDKSGEADLYFGRDTGQFLTMSVNTDYVVDAHEWGTKRILALQGICCWGTGSGDSKGLTDSDRWTASELPTGAAQLQTAADRN